MRVRSSNILKGTRVLDLADERGGFCAKLLADLGAEVTKIEMPVEKSAGLSNPPEKAPDLFSMTCLYMNMDKRGVEICRDTVEGKERLGKLIKNTDILIETRGQAVLENLGLEPAQLYRLNRALVHISISDFGRSGPKREYSSSATTVSAAGGQMFVCRDETGKPVSLFGPQPYYTASLFGAIAALIQLRRRCLTGKGNYIDLSVQEAVASTLDHVLVDYFSEGRIFKKSNGLTIDPNFPVLPCRDGLMQITILQNWDTLVEILVSEGMSEDLQESRWLQQPCRERGMEHIVEVAAKWTKKHTVQELFDLGQAMAFPWVPVAHTRMVMESPQLADRGFFIRKPVFPKGPEIVFPGSPYRFIASSRPKTELASGQDAPTSRVSDRFVAQTHPETGNRSRTSTGIGSNETILKGIRVLDLTRVLSGPYCTRILADSGAEVLKIQSGKTASGAERNETAYFRTWNRNKRSVCLDLSTPEARACLLKLAAIADIVVENYSPRVMKNWDLSYERLQKVNPSIIMLSLSAMGQTGPWRDRVGFGATFHALSGLMSASSLSLYPVNIGHAYGDIVAGLYGALAILAALDCRERTGRGRYIDLSGYEAMCTIMGPAAADTAPGIPPEAEHNIPVIDGCFRCKGTDRWCAITVEGEDQWEKLCGIMKEPALQSDKLLRNGESRGNTVEKNERIGRWTSGMSAESVERILQMSGIAAHAVQNAEDISKDPHLAARKFFKVLKHPTQGVTTSDRSAAWPWDSEPENWRPAPDLGEANRDIFVNLLGMPEQTFRDFVQRGIIG